MSALRGKRTFCSSTCGPDKRLRGGLMAWWKKALVGTCGVVLWIAGLGLAGSLGYPSQYFWFSMAIIAIAGAAVPFWRHRNAVWFWPSVGLLVVANVAVMYFERD